MTSVTSACCSEQDWSVSVDEDDAGIQWHLPTVEELTLADRILVEFLQPEMDSLRDFMAGQEMERYMIM